MAKKLQTITKTKINPKIVAGVVILVGVAGLSFIGASLLSTGVTLVNSNTNVNDSSKSNKFNPCKAHNGPNDLIVWYQFSGNANDSSGNNFAGVANGDPVFLLNTTLIFDGVNDYVAIPLNYCGGQHQINKMTACAWFSSDENTGGDFDNWALVDFDREQYFSLFLTPSGKIGFSTHSQADNSINDLYTNNDPTDPDDISFNDGSDHFACGVYDLGNKKIYVDGTLYGQVSAHNGKALGGSETRYGFIGDGSKATVFNGTRSNKYYKGFIDEVRIYERALNESEITSLDINRYVEVINRCLVANAATNFINMPASCYDEINAIPDISFTQDPIKSLIQNTLASTSKVASLSFDEVSKFIQQEPLKSMFKNVPSEPLTAATYQKSLTSTTDKSKWEAVCIPKKRAECAAYTDPAWAPVRAACFDLVQWFCDTSQKGICVGGGAADSQKDCFEQGGSAWCPFIDDCPYLPAPGHRRLCGCLNFEDEYNIFYNISKGDMWHFCQAYLNPTSIRIGGSLVTFSEQGPEFICKARGISFPSCARLGIWPHHHNPKSKAIDVFFDSNEGCGSNRVEVDAYLRNFYEYDVEYLRMNILDEMLYSTGDLGHLQFDIKAHEHFRYLNYPPNLTKPNEPCFLNAWSNGTSPAVFPQTDQKHNPPCNNYALY